MIILLAVLAVTALPRLQGGGGITEYTYQARLISALRTMQVRAMNDTRAGYCFQINVYAEQTSSFGPPSLNYATGNQTATCASTIDSDPSSEHLKASMEEMANDNVSITSGQVTINFNGLGCPDTGAGFCAQHHQIDIQGEQTVSVCIESQGYIHACD